MLITAPQQQRVVGRPFVKGMSGNPGGRKPVPYDVVKLAQSKSTLAINTLAEVCQNKKANAGARVMAASVLLDRAWGKAVQRTETKSLNVNLSELTDAQLLAMLQELNPGATLPGLPPPEDTVSSIIDTETQGKPVVIDAVAKPSHETSHETPQREASDCPFVEGCKADTPRPKRKRKQRLKPRRPQGPIPAPAGPAAGVEPGGDGDGSPL